MDWWRRILFFLGGLYGALGVAAGAAAAHLVGDDMLTTASHFLLFHAAALVAIGAASAAVDGGRAPLLTGASAIALGTFLFTGDLALRALSEGEYHWGTAPVGGSVLIVGWIFVAIGGLMARGKPQTHG
ncbi:DUF423 domain-containing protein [Xanthobacter sp. TB0136]|uniref:DUF423 domain-containing protein n=1 Tax=Xanthobacter sp. TB0136 TaxID=3459177 RepID=UPI004039C462